VRKVVSRAIGQVGFEQFWQRYDRLDRPTRQQAGRAMLKILPDALQRLERRLVAGAPDQRIKAMQIAQELGLADELREPLVQLCTDSNPRLRSKAVSVLGEVRAVPSEVLVDRLVNDTDARVRANAIEVMEQRPQAQLLPVLTQRARALNNRERANAIKALHGMKVGAAGGQLILMLRDSRPEHRISALWALRQIGWWQLINEVGRVAKEDENLRVRRYALGVLKNVVEMAREKKGAGAA
ncbi:MAG: repeat protein, partial [Phycisphaerales bacterium]|nr:repeat protein [Phycisphaerales bacterium]